LAVGAVVASSGDAVADTIPYASVPVAPLPTVTPTSAGSSSSTSSSSTPPAPLTIPATEHADGLYVAIAPPKVRKPVEDKNGFHYVSFFTSEKAAQQYATDGTYMVSYPDDRSAPRTCLAASGRQLAQRLTSTYRIRPYVEPPPSADTIARLKALHRWPPPPQPKPPAPKVAPPPHDEMQPIAMEKVTITGDTVRVDVSNVWVDMKTLGSRPRSSWSMTLKQVGQGPGGLGIYASRDDKGTMQFLVTSPSPSPATGDGDHASQVSVLSDTADRVFADLPGGPNESGCGHVRFAMDAVKPGSGEMATILATAFLPPSKDEGDDTDAPSSDDTDSAAAIARAASHEQRARPLAVNLSLSQLPSETTPLLSVSYGWAGKDRELSF
jgi:hypothetical protein